MIFAFSTQLKILGHATRNLEQDAQAKPPCKQAADTLPCARSLTAALEVQHVRAQSDLYWKGQGSSSGVLVGGNGMLMQV
jgi:hypothetical protein